MIDRKVGHYGDKSLSKYVSAGEYTFLSHHGGNLAPTIEEQLEECFNQLQETLNEIGSGKENIVKMNLYLKNFKDIQKAEQVFSNFFGKLPPARTTIETNFFEDKMLCQIDGIVYTPNN